MTLADRVGTITFDFGNTLLAVDRATLHAVVEAAGRRVVARIGPFRLDDFLAAWTAERERQFREEVPAFREVDLGERFVRVLARLRGMSPPPDDERWDQAAAAALSTPDEVAWGVDAYSDEFVAHFPPDPAVAATLADLATRHRLAILSNWPHAATVDRFLAEAGWSPFLEAVVVSQRVGTIKPHPAIFAAARAILGDPRPGTILHVGDDWVADVVGASEAGWRTAYVTGGTHDSPLPTSRRDDRARPDLEIATVHDLAAALAPRPGTAGAG